MTSHFARVTPPVGRKLQASTVQAVILGNYQTSFSTDKGSDKKSKPPITDLNLNKFQFINKDNLPKWTSTRRLKFLSLEERNAAALTDQAVSLLTKVSKKQMIGAAFLDKKASGKPRSHLGTSTAEECFGTMRAKSHLSPLNQYLMDDNKKESPSPKPPTDDVKKYDDIGGNKK